MISAVNRGATQIFLLDLVIIIINELIQYKKCNVTQLTKLLKIPQSTVSQHLSKMRGKVLKAEKKGLEMYYYITNLKASQIVGILGL
ncbi:transcriptional regulator [Bacillus mycoides]|uniref:helix-turn-helix domain-containing protein n=1 Tax=Bacillus cereus group sp. N34 TaxID=2794595 RepID=UPI00067CB758|nr:MULTISPECIES: helix-turn-helix domain-containing protein [Bacillus]MCP9228603.1 helix-turn-helix domain-containing protein [Bacillus mycoides]MED0889619.1 helix-turn-helix domain-containing protein [Bacillus mycoides]MED0929465.1 helix-turn-helix domain-containing protein [Bacillus mycoides]MED0943484.1 helix-turn-helix domain-containing protein [Bacillus mycoides]MED1023883.1 helix-turn-helix domain-containing protein [Bacillus mycoides]